MDRCRGQPVEHLLVIFGIFTSIDGIFEIAGATLATPRAGDCRR